MEVMNLGRGLVIAGLVLLALGLLAIVLNKMNLPLGHLPGDITWRRKNSTVYFPWVTCVILSILASLILWFVNRRP